MIRWFQFSVVSLPGKPRASGDDPTDLKDRFKAIA